MLDKKYYQGILDEIKNAGLGKKSASSPLLKAHKSIRPKLTAFSTSAPTTISVLPTIRNLSRRQKPATTSTVTV